MWLDADETYRYTDVILHTQTHQMSIWIILLVSDNSCRNDFTYKIHTNIQAHVFKREETFPICIQCVGLKAVRAVFGDISLLWDALPCVPLELNRQ
jgi:hypothetical protein